ncbi:MAG: hypothetical protein AAGD34_08980 [Pseudomonadota bacterium]
MLNDVLVARYILLSPRRMERGPGFDDVVHAMRVRRQELPFANAIGEPDAADADTDIDGQARS